MTKTTEQPESSPAEEIKESVTPESQPAEKSVTEDSQPPVTDETSDSSTEKEKTAVEAIKKALAEINYDSYVTAEMIPYTPGRPEKTAVAMKEIFK